MSDFFVFLDDFVDLEADVDSPLVSEAVDAPPDEAALEDDFLLFFEVLPDSDEEAAEVD